MIQSINPSQYCNCEIKGFKEINERLKKIGSMAQKEGAEGMTKIMASRIKSEAKKTVPVRTGRLKKSLTYVKRSDARKGIFTYFVGNKVGKRVKNDGWYGRLVEFGTAPHDIYPKKAKALGKKGVFGKHVSHKGIPAQNWLETAFDQSWRDALKRGARKYKRFVEGKEKILGLIKNDVD